MDLELAIDIGWHRKLSVAWFLGSPWQTDLTQRINTTSNGHIGWIDFGAMIKPLIRDARCDVLMIISACHAEAIHEIVSMQIEATSSELKHSKDRAIEMFMSTEVGESGFFELKPRHSFDGLLVKFVQKMLEYPRDLVGWSLQLFEEKLAAKMEKQHSIQPDPVWAKFTDAEPLRRTRVVVEDTTPPAGGRPGGSDATSDGLPPYEEATHD